MRAEVLSATVLRPDAEALLDRLAPLDLNAVLGGWGSREQLVDRLADRAALAAAALAGPVPAEHRPLLVLACLTFNGASRGVQEVTSRAVEVFRAYLRHPDAAPADLALVMAQHRKDLDELVPLLTRGDRIADALRSGGATDPPFFLEPVALAVAAGRAVGGGRPHEDDADARADQVAVARAVLARGVELTRHHRRSGRALPAADRGLPVIGNVDFLARLAAYRVALDEQAGYGAGDDLDRLEAAAGRLAATLGRAMRTAIGVRGLFRDAEPDVLSAFDQYADDLGSAAGPEAGRLVRLAFVLRTRHARPRADPTPPIADPEPRGDDPSVAERDHLVERLLAGLFERAEPQEVPVLLTWLRGARAPDLANGLDKLVCWLRIAVFRLEEPEPGAAPAPSRPAGLSAAELAELVHRMSRTVRPEELSGDRRTDVRRVVDLALPPLWTRRQGAVRLLVAHRRCEQVRGDTPDRRLVLARLGVRAPVQYFRAVNDPATAACCPGATRPGGEPPGRSPADAVAVCPHRPWGEIGVVDTYRTLVDGTGYSSEAVRKLLTRYRGPDREWLLGVQADLTPDGC